MSTKIQWCDETINPIQDVRKGKSGRGYYCTKCSPGCEHCYAERINRVRGNGLPFVAPHPSLEVAPVEFELIESELRKPQSWKRPRSIFWQSMGDLFHEAVPFEFVDLIMAVIALTPQHTHLTLTKRQRRMAEYFCDRLYKDSGIGEAALAMTDSIIGPLMFEQAVEKGWPQLYKGLTVCNQPELDAKMDDLLNIPGNSFLSIEPMLGPIKLDPFWLKCLGAFECDKRRPEKGKTVCHPDPCPPRVGGVILGGETGPGARPMNPVWMRMIRDQCQGARVPFFFKSWGEWAPKSHGHVSRGHRWGTITADGTWFENTTPWNGHDDDGSGEAIMIRVGREASGRLLDGREHNDLRWRVV